LMSNACASTVTSIVTEFEDMTPGGDASVRVVLGTARGARDGSGRRCGAGDVTTAAQRRCAPEV